jgi:hypothetical protein
MSTSERKNKNFLLSAYNVITGTTDEPDNLSVDVLPINIYSYNDPTLGGVVKIKIDDVSTKNITVPKDAVLLNKTIDDKDNKTDYLKKRVTDLIKDKVKVESFSKNLNNVFGKAIEGNLYGEKEITTPDTAIEKLRVISIKKPNKQSEITEFIKWLETQQQTKRVWKLEKYNDQIAYNYFQSLVSDKDVSTEVKSFVFDPTNKRQELFNKLDVSLNLTNETQNLGVEDAKNQINQIIDETKLKKVEKNIDTLITKNVNGILYKAKGSEEPMSRADVLDAIMNTRYTILNLFNGGRRTHKNKKSKTQKGGRRHKKTRKH